MITVKQARCTGFGEYLVGVYVVINGEETPIGEIPIDDDNVESEEQAVEAAKAQIVNRLCKTLWMESW